MIAVSKRFLVFFAALVLVGFLMMLTYTVLKFVGVLQPSPAARTLDRFYADVGRGDYAAARRNAELHYPTADDVRRWAADERTTHGSPTGARIVEATWGNFGHNGHASYLVRYQDGAEEHATTTLTFDGFAAALVTLPGHTLEQRLRDCFAPTGVILTFGTATPQAGAGWELIYTVAHPDGSHDTAIAIGFLTMSLCPR